MIPKKVIKFPLKMKNGAEVRNLEELNANADLESIMQYYFSGQLTRWCNAFGMTDLSEQFDNNKVKYVESILSSLGLNGTIPESEIVRYVNENFGDNTVHDIVPDLEEAFIVDDKYVKENLSLMIDKRLDINDYSIEVVPIKDNNGDIQKYRVCINNEKNDQYIRFSIRYNIDDEYIRDFFIKDLFRKISNAIISLEDIHKVNDTKELFRYLKVGDTFGFGSFEGKKIKWKVIKKDDESLYMIATEILCKRKFDSSSNSWANSEIYQWLKGDFYNSAFTEDEKKKLNTVDSHYVMLLSKEILAELMTKQERSIGSSWWLSSSYNDTSSYVWCVRDDGSISDIRINNEIGVRPVLYLRFKPFKFSSFFKKLFKYGK